MELALRGKVLKLVVDSENVMSKMLLCVGVVGVADAEMVEVIGVRITKIIRLKHNESSS